MENKVINSIILLEKAFENGKISKSDFQKALDKSKLTKKIITDKNGHTTTKWVSKDEPETVKDSKSEKVSKKVKNEKQDKDDFIEKINISQILKEKSDLYSILKESFKGGKYVNISTTFKGEPINIPIHVKKWKDGESVAQQDFFDENGAKYQLFTQNTISGELINWGKIKITPSEYLQGGSKYSENFKNSDFKKISKDKVDESLKLGREINNFLKDEKLILKQDNRSEILSDMKNKFPEEAIECMSKIIHFIEDYSGVQSFRYELENNEKFKELVYKSCDSNVEETIYRKFISDENTKYKVGQNIKIGEECCSFSTDLKFIERYNEEEINDGEIPIIFILDKCKKSLNLKNINEWESEKLVMNTKGFKIKKVTERKGIKYVEIEE